MSADAPTSPARRLQRLAHRLEDALLCLLFGALLVLAVSQIALRNTFGGGPAWTEELLRLLVLWLAMAGAAAATRSVGHVSIDLLSRILKGRSLGFAKAATTLFSAAVTALVAWHTWRFVAGEREAGSQVLGETPAWIAQAVIPAAFALISLRYFFLFLQEAHHSARGKEPR